MDLRREIKMINQWIQLLVSYGYQQGLLKREDIVYAVNRICAYLELDQYEGGFDIIREPIDHIDILSNLTDYAYEKGLIESPNPPFSDLFDTGLMDIMMPRPSEVIRMFRTLYSEGPETATNYYYNLSKASHYIRTDRIKKNMHWQVDSAYGAIDISVNLSKPEKDPKAIAMGQHQVASSYPKCLLCYENVGYQGHVNHPARQNHRVIPLSLQGEQWYFQYSPYVYFNEHSIVFKSTHDPMKITEKTFERLLDFVDQLPHYFIGSNADLPIVGGSMLSHDHYQSGYTVFPMEKATTIETFKLKTHKNIEVQWLNWPLTVLRLRSDSRAALVTCANEVTKVWRNHSDVACDIHASSDAIPHNTVTPIARFKENMYELDIVLRNNRITDEHPDGIFHPHVEIHPVKKENIGLIEVMGLAVLPSRLKDQMKGMATALELGAPADLLKEKDQLSGFSELYEEMQLLYRSSDDAVACVHQVVGEAFVKGLEHSGVYKLDKRGHGGMKRFIEGMNQ